MKIRFLWRESANNDGWCWQWWVNGNDNHWFCQIPDRQPEDCMLALNEILEPYGTH